MGTSKDGSGRPSKVVRLIDQYNLRDLGDELEALWTADDPSKRKSLRELADYVNRQVLRSAQKDAGIRSIESTVENTYNLLVDDDASTADRTRIERKLEQEGLDIAALRSDFVSYQAVRRYLENHRNAEYPADDGDSVKQSRETIQRLRSRTTNVTESKVDRLQKTGVLSLGEEVSATVDIRIRCDDCGTRFSVQDLFTRRECACIDT